jgi:tetratricopeptide (TPR) repeat protein
VLLTVLGLSVGVVLIGQARARTEAQRKIAEEQRKIADEQRDRADQQREIASDNAKRAFRNSQLAQDAADGLLGEVADVDLSDIPQMGPVRKRLLEKARNSYQQFFVQEGNDPRIRWGAARAQVRMGKIQALLGEVPKAQVTLLDSTAKLEGLAKEDPSNADIRRDEARSLHALGMLLKDANRFRDGESKLSDAIRLREEIAKLPDATGEDTEALADSRYQLGALLARTGSRGTEVLEAYGAALAQQEQLAKQNAGRPELVTQLARVRNNLGIFQRSLAKNAEAEATFRSALELLNPLVKARNSLPGPRWQFARASNNLGALLLKSRTDEAGAHLHQAQALLQTLAAEFPDVAQYFQELASVEYNLGLLAKNTLHPDQAVASFKESVRLLEELKKRFAGSPAYSIRLAVSQVALGQALIATTPDEAEGSLRKALNEQLALLAEYPGVPEYLRMAGRSHYQLAESLLSLKKPIDAVAQAEKAKERYNEVLRISPDSEPDQYSLFECHNILIRALIAGGQIDGAMSAAEQLPTIRPSDPALYVHAAAYLIQCANIMPATPAGRKQQEAILSRAVDLLGKAVQAKVIRVKRTLEEKSLLPLRERDDFKKLLKSLDDSVHIG